MNQIHNLKKKESEPKKDEMFVSLVENLNKEIDMVWKNIEKKDTAIEKRVKAVKYLSPSHNDSNYGSNKMINV
jgi:hypothetical protein